MHKLYLSWCKLGVSCTYIRLCVCVCVCVWRERERERERERRHPCPGMILKIFNVLPAWTIWMLALRIIISVSESRYISIKEIMLFFPQMYLIWCDIITHIIYCLYVDKNIHFSIYCWLQRYAKKVMWMTFRTIAIYVCVSGKDCPSEEPLSGLFMWIMLLNILATSLSEKASESTSSPIRVTCGIIIL